MTGLHGNTGKHLAELPKTTQRRLIEQAIARWGTPYKAAEKLGIADDQALEVWRELLAEDTEDEAPPARRRLAPCGTPAAYRRHVRNGETPDMECLKWYTIDCQDRYRRDYQRGLMSA